MDQVQNDEIDLISVFETIWDGKWKIIFFIFITSMACISFLLFTPNSFKVTTILQEGNQNLYYKYKYLNDILEMDNEYLGDLNNPLGNNANQVTVEQTIFSKEPQEEIKEFIISDLVIFNEFINEFNDYQEIVTVLSKNDSIKDEIKNLNVKDKREALISFAKNFTIIKPKKEFEPWQISFVWHDVREGNLLFNKALQLTLINVQKSLTMRINDIAKAMDKENQRKKASLNTVLNSIRALNKLTRIKRIRYLIEQSDIAKELGIEKNQLDKLTIVSPDYPYFLRGFKAIDKEIDLIKSRSKEENDLMSEGYFDIKRKLILIEKDIRSKQLRDANKSIKKDNLSKWVSFNLELAEIENVKNPYIYISLSIIIGGILGTFYVLISEGFRKRKII